MLGRSRPWCGALCLWLALPAVALPAVGAADQDAALEAAFQDYWSAGRASKRKAAVAAILGLDPDFDAVWERLRRGRPYSRDVETGARLRSNRSIYHYAVLVPKDYDPERRYPVRVYLHGGVGRPAWPRDGSWWPNYRTMAAPDWILVFPASWNEAMWWEWEQARNLAEILDGLKRTYNINENRVYLLGYSDGASGVYFYAFRRPMAWAAFLAFNGHPGVLNHAALEADGQMYVPNLRHRAMFIVNGALDQLYPSRSMVPYVDLFRRGGAEIEFRNLPEHGHGLKWYPEESERIEAFIRDHVRGPYPDRITWETERIDRYARFHWLVITELGEVEAQSAFDDFNVLNPLPQQAFVRSRPSGRVELVRQDNRIVVHTRGVRRFKLLLSPDQFDFSRPITVITNGATSFDGPVTLDSATLLRWAGEDQDRTMLFGAELEIEVGAKAIRTQRRP
ncbi:MAG: hypothetical protein GY856_46010 [bacterium]|nr:hypothetical protein [bacterium]